MTVQNIAGNSLKTFTPNEEAMLDTPMTTRDAMAKVAREHGQPEIVIRGDDSTYTELKNSSAYGTKKEVATKVGDEVSGAIVEHFAHEGVESILEHVLPKAASVLGPIGIVHASIELSLKMKDLAMKPFEHGQSLKGAEDRMGFHMTLLNEIALPGGYREGEIKKLTEGFKDATGDRYVSALVEFRNRNGALVSVLQFHSDEGTVAAKKMLEAGADKAAYLKSNPSVNERYASDAAFHAGFDALVWAKSNDASDYRALLDGVNARDARYQAHHLHVQG